MKFYLDFDRIVLDEVKLLLLIYFSILIKVVIDTEFDDVMIKFDIKPFLLYGVVIQMCKIEIKFHEKEIYLKKAKDTFEEFNRTCKVKYLGISQIVHQNICGVRYPVDFFIKHFYDRYFPNEVSEAENTYRRVNPALDLRLEHLNKFGEDQPIQCDDDEIFGYVVALYKEFRASPSYNGCIAAIERNFLERRFHELDIDTTSAAGYPYNQGVKRREVIEDAIERADDMLNNESAFNCFMDAHCWYTTGRARMIKTDKPDKGRIIMYAGFSPMLIAMLFVQPLARMMNSSFDWCAVGMSWMHGGARKFAEYFRADEGYAPAGYRYVSVDIKEWDAKLSHRWMWALYKFHSLIFEDVRIEKSYSEKYLAVVADMIQAKVLMPLGRIYQLFQGMKSGWANTANDNTAIHRMVFMRVQNILECRMLHKLYGDDNFMLVPNFISDDDIRAAYLASGCEVGSIHSSSYIGDVDFLSKYVNYKDGEYFIYRPSVETHARILFPEEFNPAMRDRPDCIIAAERCLGHLFDNPFNAGVREVCYTLLRKLRDHYDVHEISINDRMRKMHPWRQFKDLPSVMPSVPTISFIENLYGVSVVPLNNVWPNCVDFFKFSFTEHALNYAPFIDAYAYSLNVHQRLLRFSRRRRKAIVKACSPYAVPKGVYGTHAARLEFAIKYFNLPVNDVLDLGSHPGACAASLTKVARHITCVSLKPSIDYRQEFCPYVFRESKVVLIEGNADEYIHDGNVDLIHDDVDLVGPRGRKEDIELAIAALNRAVRYRKVTANYLLTIREVTPRIIEHLFEVYKLFGDFDIVKPYYSNPWKCEFMVLFRRKSGHTAKKSTFLHSLYAFLNKHVKDMMNWSHKLNNIILEIETDPHIPRNPMQTNEEFQKGFAKWLLSRDALII